MGVEGAGRVGRAAGPGAGDELVLGVEGAGFAAATKGLDRNAARLL